MVRVTRVELAAAAALMPPCRFAATIKMQEAASLKTAASDEAKEKTCPCGQVFLLLGPSD